MKAFKIPIVATIHHPIILDKIADFTQAKDWWEKWRRTKFYSFHSMQGIVTRRIERIIAPSFSSAGEIEHFLKVPPSRIKVIYLGIDTSLFHRQNMAKEPHSLLMVSNTEDRKKGVIYLLQALLLLKEDTEVKLTIVDEGSDNRYAPRLVREYGLSDRVTFTGKLSHSELVEHYSKAEIVVLPSLYEGFGFPAAEAMACEVPVIATTAGALPEIVVDGETGITVPPADPYALSIAIRRLLSDEALRRRLGKAGRKRVEQNFTWEKTAKETLQVYEELNAHRNP
jgi:glycosyltransferase involved in cell wall biosynthesis